MTVREAIEQRRSIRSYRATPVAESDLRLILEAGRLAPSGCNAQPWRFIVVRDAAVKERLATEAMALPRNAEVCREAPVVIVCLAALDAHCGIPERMVELAATGAGFGTPEVARELGGAMKARFDTMPAGALAAYMAENVAIALTQMLLQAAELGYGTCWMGAFDRGVARRILEVPEGYELIAVTPLGRPAEAPPPRPRLPLASLVFGDKFGAELSL